MPRRKIRYPEKPHVMAEDIRRKFQAIIDKGKEKLPDPKWLFDGTEKWKKQF